MRLVMYSIVLACALGLGMAPARAAAPVATVLGKGPEVHLFPSYGPVGTHVTVVGLGFRPGAQVRIVYGPPNAEFLTPPLAGATVGPLGRFYTGFTVTRKLLLGHAMQPLIVGGFEAAKAGQGGTAVTAFIVTVA